MEFKYKEISHQQVDVKKPADLTWQVDLRKLRLLIYPVSACKANRHAGWRGVDTTAGKVLKNLG